MRHPYEKFIRIELFSIGFAVFLGVFAFIQGYMILMFVSFYLISISLIAEAMVAWSTFHKQQAIKSVCRALLIFLLVTYLFFQL